MGTPVYSSTGTSSNILTRLPHERRHEPIQYGNDDGTIGETRYPINYEELYNLKGRLLTIVDATFSDPEQRKAHKDIVWQTLKGWMDNIEQAGTFGHTALKDSGEDAA